MKNNDVHKDNESRETFVQNDVFKELELAENAVQDIYQFKEDFRVKTVYEKFAGLYKFGGKFKYILSFLTASLACIGLFFLFYFDTFEGFINYVLIGLAAIFGLSVAIALEYSKYVIAPLVAKSWLRDKKIQKGLVIASLVIILISVSSTIYGTYKIIELYYVPVLVDGKTVGGEQLELITSYQTKIADAKTEKEGIEKRRKSYEKRSGKNGSWIQDEVYNQLVVDVSGYEAQIATLRGQIRTDKESTELKNESTLKTHENAKYGFVWVGGIVALLCEIVLLTVLFLLQKYKFSTLKQLDTIQAPLQTVLQLVENPLTQLKSTLIGSGQLVINQGANVSPLAINQNANIPPIQMQNKEPGTNENQPPKMEKKQRPIGFQFAPKKTPEIEKEKPIGKEDKPIEVQRVGVDELSKIELKIIHFTSQVKQSENRLKTLKQKAAIEKCKAALKNRKNKLRYWKKKKEAYQGKIIA